MRIMGICNLHSTVNLGQLTSQRPLASTSFLGRYAFMDFPLSNFSNSGIDEVCILVQNNPRSILKHLGSSNAWNNNTKLGYEAILYNEKYNHSPMYNHDINNLLANDWIFYDVQPDVFVIAPVHIIFPVDFRQAIKKHLAQKVGISVIYTKIKNGKSNFLEGDILKVDAHHYISEMQLNRGQEDEVNVSLETYIIGREKMRQLLNKANRLSSLYNLKDIIRHLISQKEEIFACEYKGYVRCFDSLEAYHKYSTELLDYPVRASLFLYNWPIYTTTHDTPPTRYLPTSEVSHAFIANGAQIGGTVKNSIISRNVVIEEGAIVENSIIFTNTKISSGVHISNCVIDKHCRAKNTKKIQGSIELPLYVKQGDHL